MTRRNFIGTGIAGVTCSALGSPTRGSLGAREQQYNDANALPYDAEVEYLEGGLLDSGIAFIDTGYCPTYFTRIEAMVAALSGWGYSGRFGNRIRLTFGFSNGNKTLYLAQGEHYYLGIATEGVYYNFINDIPKRIVAVEGIGTKVTSTVSDWYSQLYPLYLFASNVAPIEGTHVNGCVLDTNSLGRQRMAFCKIWESEALHRDFVPVRFTNEYGLAEGAMYDRVSGQLFRNQGTGSFIIGPDV